MFHITKAILFLVHDFLKNKLFLLLFLLKVSCTIKSSNKSRNIPIITRISDINDNAPLFTNVPYETTVPEVS